MLLYNNECKIVLDGSKEIAKWMGHVRCEPYHLLISLARHDKPFQAGLERYGYGEVVAWDIIKVLQKPVWPVPYSQNSVRISQIFSKAVRLANSYQAKKLELAHLVEAMLKYESNHTKVIGTFVPCDILLDELFGSYTESFVNQVKIEEI